MKLCRVCGGDVRRGWSSGGNGERTRCLVCETAALLGVRPSRERPCACGCGRVRIVKALGLSAYCYQAMRRAGRLQSWKEARQHA